MQRKEILEKVIGLVAQRFDLDPAHIHGETRRADMNIDSILMLDLMLDIESEMGLIFREIDLPPNPKINDVVDLIEANVGAGGTVGPGQARAG